MGLRFRKSIKIAPGVRLNLSKKGVGISAGVKGARMSINSQGRRTTTFSIPGTGISYSTSSSMKKNAAKNKTTQRGYTGYAAHAPAPVKSAACKLKTPPSKWYLFWGIVFFIAGIAYIPKGLTVAILIAAIGVAAAFHWYNGRRQPQKYASDQDWLSWQQLLEPDCTALTMNKKQLSEASQQIAAERTDDINTCIKTISTTTNIDRFFEAYEALEEHQDFFKNLESYMAIINPIPASYFDHKDRYVKRIMDDAWTKASEKAATLKTDQGKANQFLRYSSAFKAHEAELPESCIAYYQAKHSGE